MKDSIEEKAKAYDKVVNKLKVFIVQGVDPLITKADVQDFFPELKENEDEIIRKAIIKGLSSCGTKYWGGFEVKAAIDWLEKQEPIDKEKVLIGARKDVALSIINYLDNNSVGMCLSNMECEDIKDACVNSKWTKLYNYMKKKLEKQDEQKPIAKVEPKFKVGHWIVSNVSHEDYRICKILKIENGEYVIESIYGYRGHNNFETFDKDYRLWSIQDAKDGDILASACNENPFIFKGCIDSTHPNGPVAYCGIDYENKFVVCENTRFWWTDYPVHPATKEQRDQLEKAMANAGYTFDFDKKELKKIKHNPTEQIENFDVKSFDKEYNEFCKKNKIKTDDNSYKIARYFAYWQKHTWSEEDEKLYSRIYKLIHEAAFANYDVDEDGNELGEYAKITKWFKSLKERYTWKPSDEQIKVCKKVYADILSAKGFDLGTVNSELNRLEEELKELKE